MRKASIARHSISINRRHVTKGGVINVLIQVDQHNSSIIDSLAVSTSPNYLPTAGQPLALNYSWFREGWGQRRHNNAM